MEKEILVYDVMLGSKLVVYGNEKILIGQPPEIIKALMLKKLPPPNGLLLTNRLEKYGILQNCVEFPLYYHLFIGGGFKDNIKLKIIGNKTNVNNIKELLKMTLLGPTKEELLKTGINSKIAESLANESKHFSLKDKDGNPYSIDFYIDTYTYDDYDSIKTDELQISHLGNDNYIITAGDKKTELNLDFNGKQQPPYQVQIDFVPNELCKFGVDILGGASGFNPNHSSSGLVLSHNGNYLLIDCIPYLDTHLLARGVSKNQINGFFLTHIHDDHCNMMPLILSNRKMDCLTTRDIYWMAIKKLSLMLNKPIEEIETYFNFIPLTEGETSNYYGLKIKPHYGCHTIPTIGATFGIYDCGYNYTINIVGDNQSLKELKKMAEKNIIQESKYKQIEAMFHDYSDLLIPDGGMGMIHGDPKDAINSKADRVLFIHVDSLPSEFSAQFSVASAGKRYIVKKGDGSYYVAKTIEFILEKAGKGINPLWISTLIGDKKILHLNQGDIILKQGTKSKGKIYMILTGYCDVVLHDGMKSIHIASLEAGEFVGEMAIITGAKMRNASVVAKSPVILCEMHDEIFYKFANNENIKDSLLNMWKNRGVVSKLNLFNNFPNIVIDKIARIAFHKEFKEFEDIIVKEQKEEYFYILLSGKVKVEKECYSTILENTGNHFGNYLPFNEKIDCNVKSLSNTEVLEIEKSKLENILENTPLLKYYLSESFCRERQQ